MHDGCPDASARGSEDVRRVRGFVRWGCRRLALHSLAARDAKPITFLRSLPPELIARLLLYGACTRHSSMQPEDRYQWSDQDWMSRRKELGQKDLLRRQPMAIYEVHLPSWMRGDNNTYLCKSFPFSLSLSFCLSFFLVLWSV